MRYTQEMLLNRSLELPVQPSATSTRTRRCRTTGSQNLANRALREALEPYVDLRKLRRLAAHSGDLQEALITGAVPEDVQAMITFVAELLRPVGRDRSRARPTPQLS